MDNTISQSSTGSSSSPGYSQGNGFWEGYDAMQTFFEETFAITDGWNLISMPKTTIDYHKNVLYPGAASDAFEYTGSYVTAALIMNGTGYWLKYAGDQLITLPGVPLTNDTITVKKGWNIIGSIGSAVNTGTIIQIPSGIVVSSYFAYNGSYSVAGSIEPGKGYWVKVNAGGKLVLSAPPAFAPVAVNNQQQNELSNLNVLTVQPQGKLAKGHSQQLLFGKAGQESSKTDAYEMPPVAPSGGLDVRFGSNQFAEFFSGEQKEVPIHIQSNGAPLELSWTMKEMAGLSYVLVEKKGEKIIAEHKLKTGGSIILKNTENYSYTLRVEEVPLRFALEQNYPNPFNPTTVIRYDVPLSTRVTMKVYDMLGREVATLVDGELEAGHQSVEWNVPQSGIASGVYFYRMQAGTFTETKKLMLLK